MGRKQRRSHPTRKEQLPLQSAPRCRICSGVAYDRLHIPFLRRVRSFVTMQESGVL